MPVADASDITHGRTIAASTCYKTTRSSPLRAYPAGRAETLPSNVQKYTLRYRQASRDHLITTMYFPSQITKGFIMQSVYRTRPYTT
ncbi:hypothetical protein AX14_005566 [Amanita brunnescens Koide BX004]|nr:hypothetical protein AX14_005566 [Amanita brunnescens Koide BX004]